MKILLVGNGAREHIIAERIAEGGELLAAMGKKNPGISGLASASKVFDAFEPQAVAKWAAEKKADLAFVGPDALLAAGFGDALENAGIPTASPTKVASRIEWDKSYARLLMKEHSIPGLPEFQIVDSEQEARKIISSLGSVAVKPLGLTGGKGVRVSGDHFKNAEEAIAYACEVIRSDGSALIEEKLEGEEFSLQLFSDGNRISPMPPVQDHKRAYEGDAGPNCYSSDTEILTDHSWKTFNKLDRTDRVMVYDPHWKIMQFQKPLEIYWMKHRGKMCHFKNRDIDLLVTPNHRMLIQSRRKKKRICIVEAEKYMGENYIFQSAKWNGRAKKYFKLPAYKKHFRFKSLKIKMLDWAMFMGIYLSEGCAQISRGGGRVYICQSKKSKHLRAMGKILQKLPFKFVLDEKGFRINSMQLAAYLRVFGVSSDKYVPDYIKNAGKETISPFLEAFCMGDGDIHYGKMRFHSGSKRLMGDIQEMVAKIGCSGVICTDKRKTMLNPINKKRYAANPVYSLEIKKKCKSAIRKKHVKKVEYSGYVGCVSVSTGFVLVRRNGRVAICGNTGGMGSYTTGDLLPFMRKSDLEEALEISQKVVDAMRKSGTPFKGVLYTQGMCTSSGLKIIEFNARFGDPEAMNALSLIQSDFTSVLQSISDGNLRAPQFSKNASVVKYLVPEGYPDKPVPDSPISVDTARMSATGAAFYYASVYEKEGTIYTTSSRAVGVVGVAGSISQAEQIAESATAFVSGPLWHRKDIGAKELLEKRVSHMGELRK